MKKLFVIGFVLILSSCGKTSATLEHVSSNGKVKINITGSRPMATEAWQVVMKVKSYNFKEQELVFEVNASDINKETVSFKWENENNCLIIFKQSDNSSRIFSLLASPSEFELRHVSDNP
ncbi:MAG: hypothetical protein ACHQK8_01345 [Bacteroidia bacterium]